MKKDKKKSLSKTGFGDPIEKWMNIAAKLPAYAYTSKIVQLIVYEDPIEHYVYFLSFINSIKIILSPFSETYMLLMYYP